MGTLEEEPMKTKLSIRRYFFSGSFAGFVLLTISVLLAPIMSCEGKRGINGFTLRVTLDGSIPVAVREIPKYLRAVSVHDERGDKLEVSQSQRLKKGYRLEVEFREGIDTVEFSKPVSAALHAPVYLGKRVEVERVAGEELGVKRGTIIIPEEDLSLAVEGDGTITNLEYNRKVLDKTIEIIFQHDIIARAERIVGIKPIRTRSFQLLDQLVSAGEEVRIRIPMPNIDPKDSHLAVGFWTVHPDSSLEEDAYLADITGIEPQKVGSSNYIVKARMPYLSELEHVEPGCCCPYPPKVKMTVTTKLGSNQIIAETFDLRVTRRGWGFTAGMLFLIVVLLTIMYVTKDFNPFKKDTARNRKWIETYKSNWLKRFFFSPLDFAVTPFGTYSISVSQALFWTFIVAFSCVYVYMLKASFIVIPNQILALLGITGGTALASRINAVTRDLVPDDLIKDIRRTNIPRLRDMISIAGRMNIYKFQMMVFTLLTGIIVLIELIKACNFPEIPNTLIVLMGLSNTLYLGNEVTVEPLEGLREKVKAYKEEEDEDKRKKLGDDIKDMLSKY
jgi:hypothetical protein